jgi:hypothetical protein
MTLAIDHLVIQRILGTYCNGRDVDTYSEFGRNHGRGFEAQKHKSPRAMGRYCTRSRHLGIYNLANLSGSGCL